jgi:hypothetical protein
MENITKEELMAMIATQSKATEQMVIIANYLREITEEQKKITERLTNGVKKEITESITKELQICNVKLTDEVEQIDKMLTDRGAVITNISNDISFTKWFIGIVGIVVVIATVILRGIDATKNEAVHQQDVMDIQQLHEALHNAGVVAHIPEKTEQ